MRRHYSKFHPSCLEDLNRIAKRLVGDHHIAPSWVQPQRPSGEAQTGRWVDQPDFSSRRPTSNSTPSTVSQCPTAPQEHRNLNQATETPYQPQFPASGVSGAAPQQEATLPELVLGDFDLSPVEEVTALSPAASLSLLFPDIADHDQKSIPTTRGKPLAWFQAQQPQEGQSSSPPAPQESTVEASTSIVFKESKSSKKTKKSLIEKALEGRITKVTETIIRTYRTGNLGHVSRTRVYEIGKKNS